MLYQKKRIREALFIMNRMNKHKRSESENKYLRPLAVGTVTGGLVTLGIIMICALFYVLRDMPQSTAMPIALVASGLGSLAGGVTAAKSMKQQGMIIGGLTGLTLFAVTFIVSLFVSEGGLTVFTPMRLLIMTLASAMGGVLGVNSSAKRKMI